MVGWGDCGGMRGLWWDEGTGVIRDLYVYNRHYQIEN